MTDLSLFHLGRCNYTPFHFMQFFALFINSVTAQFVDKYNLSKMFYNTYQSRQYVLYIHTLAYKLAYLISSKNFE